MYEFQKRHSYSKCYLILCFIVLLTAAGCSNCQVRSAKKNSVDIGSVAVVERFWIACLGRDLDTVNSILVTDGRWDAGAAIYYVSGKESETKSMGSGEIWAMPFSLVEIEGSEDVTVACELWHVVPGEPWQKTGVDIELNLKYHEGLWKIDLSNLGTPYEVRILPEENTGEEIEFPTE